jgi:hypothetical protein
MWQRAVRGDPIARSILVHEFAHVVYRDGRRLVYLARIVRAAKVTLLASVGAMLMTATVAAAVYVARSFTTFADLAWHVAGVSSLCLLVLIIPVIGMQTIRRQAALITALSEVRADVAASAWNREAKRFGELLEADPTLKGSSIEDLRHSLMSSRMTHLSNAERISLLKDDERLSSPKIRYFAFSVLLAFMIPLNPYTPLFVGGAFDYLLMAAVVASAQFTVLGMLIISCSARGKSVSLRGATKSALFLCVLICVAHVNMYEVGYVLTHWSASFVTPGGFGGGHTTIASLLGDAKSALNGLWKRLQETADGSMFPVALAVSAASLLGCSWLAAKSSFGLSS